MSSSALNIRPAAPGDGELVFEFIYGLAEYEKLAHEVVATPESVEQTLFGADRRAGLIGEQTQPLLHHLGLSSDHYAPFMILGFFDFFRRRLDARHLPALMPLFEHL